MVTVLIVEDEPDYARAMADWISEHDVLISTTGEDALATFDDSIDVVLLDRRLPDISGQKVLKAIRESEGDCRVAMVTAVEPDFDILKMGFDEYMVKPVTEEQLQSLLKRLVRLSKYDAQIRRLYQLSSQKVALEDSKSPEELRSNREYQELVQEFEELRTNLDEALSQLLDEDPKIVIN